MTSPERDPEHPVQTNIFLPPRLCEHPRSQIRFTGHFPPENYELSVFEAHCYSCGSAWNQNDNDAPWDQLMLKIAHGEYGVVSAEEPEIAGISEWKRQTRYDQIMRDVTGDSNPILASNVELKRPD